MLHGHMVYDGVVLSSTKLSTMFWLVKAAVLVVLGLLALTEGFPQDDFVSYGQLAGDRDTYSFEVERRFYLYGTACNFVKVTRDGTIILLSEQDRSPAATLSVFKTNPAPSSIQGQFYYRIMIDTQSIEEEVSFALEVINSSLIGRHITPVWAFVATWVGMTHPSTHAGNNENINTFQAVLIRGEEWSDSFVVYMYNHTNWPTAVDGGSSIAALETADLDPEHQYIVPGSQVGDVASVVDTTNVGHPGMWVFHVGKDHRSLLSDTDEFYFAFAPTASTRMVELYALITTKEEEEVSFTVQAPGINNFKQAGVVQRGQHVRVDFPQTSSVQRADINKGILIKAANKKRFSVIGVMKSGTQIARFPVLHQRNSSTQYVYYAASKDDYVIGFQSFIIIVAMADRTTITVTASVPCLVGRRRLSTGRQLRITLNRLGTTLIASPRDLTGTRIESTGNPIVVFSGHSCTQIPVFYQSCDTIMEQIPSTYDWGKEFIAAPLKNRRYSLLQILAAVTPTSVIINCISEDGPRRHSRTLTVREKVQATQVIFHNEICSVVADEPIMLIEYSVSRQVDNIQPMIGGPAMMLVPSVMQYSQDAAIIVQDDSYDQFVNLIFPEMYYQPDKTKLNMTHTVKEFNPDVMVYYDNCSIKYYVCRVKLPVGDYFIMHPLPEARFGVIAYGHFGTSSYGYLAGLASSGVKFEDKPTKRVKVMSNSGFGGVCLNTTTQEVLWRTQNGSVVSVNSFLDVNNSGDSYTCEAPFMGFEPTFVYKERVTFVQEEVSTDTDTPGNCEGGTKCAFTARVLPSEAVVEVGDDISFHCIFPEDFSASVTWQGPYLKKQGPVLYLENVNISSTGKYTCSVVNNEGMMTNASTHLTVQRHLPVIDGHGYQVNISLTGISAAEVTLNVSIDVEHGSIEWSRQNGEMPTNAVMKAGGSLMIPDVHLEDAGNYSCTARNRSGAVTLEMFEIITEVQPPTIVMNPVNQTILVNTTLVLSCYAIGYGAIAYQWEERHTGVLVETGSHLIIEDVEGHSVGEYTCLASNAGGITRSLSAFVGVLKPETNDITFEQGMVAFVGPYELVAPEGDNASFFCYGAHGSGNYSYLWFNKGKEVVGNQSSLDILHVKPDMTGEYTCLTFDGTGLEANASVFLIVLNKTLNIINNPCNVDISISDRSRTVSFLCTANRLDAQYTWEMKNQTITNRALGVNSSLLVIPNLAVSDAGKYRCTVSDRNMSVSSSYAKLTISVEPPVLKYPPNDMTTALEGNVTLACHAQGYGPLTYVWEKKGIGIVHSSSLPHYDVVNATASSAGLYRCLVTNLYGEKVVSLYFKLTVRHSRIVEYRDCNSSDPGTEVLVIDNLKAPSFLNRENLLLDGPVFTTSRKLSKTMQLVQKAMIYVCQEQGNNFALRFGIAISSKWVLTTIECEDRNCGNLYILPTQQLDTGMKIDQLCSKESLKQRGVVKIRPQNIHTSPNGTSLTLLQLDRKSMLRNFIPKDTFLARKALMRLKSGFPVEIVGTSLDNSNIGQPSRYKYKIRSELLPDSAAPPTRGGDECSGQLPSTCSWIPGSPIIYAPPQTSQFAIIGITVPRDDCKEGGVYESHLSLQPDLEWIEITVEY